MSDPGWYWATRADPDPLFRGPWQVVKLDADGVRVVGEDGTFDVSRFMLGPRIEPPTEPRDDDRVILFVSPDQDGSYRDGPLSADERAEAHAIMRRHGTFPQGTV